MPKVKVILFDLDGTLRDSLEMIWQSFEHALGQQGVTATREEILPHIHHQEEVHKNLAPQAPKQEFLEQYQKKVDELRPQMALYQSAPGVLRDLHKNGYQLGIVTTASTAPKTMEEAKLAHLFDVIVGRLDTKLHKPHPEPILLAIDRLDCSAKDAVMVGDLPADITAAKAAGLVAAIGITHGFGTRQMLEDAGADHIIDALEELPKLLDTINNGS